MQSTRLYSPAAADADGYADNVTGASWPLTANSPGDGMSHKVTITNNTINDHSAKTATITGADLYGKEVKETINLPAGSATVTSTKFFATVASVVPSATIGVDTMDIGWGAEAELPPYPLNHQQTDFEVGFSIDVSGTINLKVQHTYGSMREPSDLVWFDHATLTAVTADAEGSYQNPITALRLFVNSINAGATASLSVVQSN